MKECNEACQIEPPAYRGRAATSSSVRLCKSVGCDRMMHALLEPAILCVASPALVPVIVAPEKHIIQVLASALQASRAYTCCLTNIFRFRWYCTSASSRLVCFHRCEASLR